MDVLVKLVVVTFEVLVWQQPSLLRFVGEQAVELADCVVVLVEVAAV